MLAAQICGGVVGLTVAWLINYYFEMRSNKLDEQLQAQHIKELEEFKKSLIQ